MNKQLRLHKPIVLCILSLLPRLIPILKGTYAYDTAQCQPHDINWKYGMADIFIIPLKVLTVGPAVCLTEWVLSPFIFYLKAEEGVTKHCRHNLCFRKWPMSSNDPDIMIPDHCQKPSELYYNVISTGISMDSLSFHDYSRTAPKSHPTSHVMGSASSFFRSNADRWKKPITHICLEYNFIMCLQCMMWCNRQHQWLIKYQNYWVTYRRQHYSSLSNHWLFLTKNTRIQFK